MAKSDDPFRWFDSSPEVIRLVVMMYVAATRGYLEAHGKPVAFYSDKHSVFRANKTGLTGDGMT
ncbi:MAG TPA: hypothetical protein VJS38_18675 [Phenylobacterium sp.]|uniref:hypothetical protein n=1 Tax=Phenylobacterium sp. TaxID=1871053 RepID=UPI002B46D5F8|nr:hypothetical protein [Phenylobacterium sp.]HKR90198.1 hypothetical protein [Phenylobacterium sp.]